MSIFLIFVIVGLFSFCHCRTFFFLSLSGFFLFVIVGLDPAIQKIQGRALRYAHRKQRASTKVRTAADNAVKLATTCHVRLWAGHFPHRSPGRVPPEDDTRGDTWAKPKHDNCLPVIFRLSSFLVIPVPSISFVIPRLDRGIPRLPDQVRQWQWEKGLDTEIYKGEIPRVWHCMPPEDDTRGDTWVKPEYDGISLGCRIFAGWKNAFDAYLNI